MQEKENFRRDFIGNLAHNKRKEITLDSIKEIN